MALSDNPRHPSVGIRARAASMIQSASVPVAPELRPRRLVLPVLAISAREFARPDRRGGDCPADQWRETVIGHQHIKCSAGCASGTSDVLSELRGALFGYARQFARPRYGQAGQL